jgi:hypothetical protein
MISSAWKARVGIRTVALESGSKTDACKRHAASGAIAVGTLIDSSVLIAAERRALDLDAAIVAHADEPVAIAAITASELLHGVHRAVTATQRVRSPSAPPTQPTT